MAGRSRVALEAGLAALRTTAGSESAAAVSSIVDVGAGGLLALTEALPMSSASSLPRVAKHLVERCTATTRPCIGTIGHQLYQIWTPWQKENYVGLEY